MEQDAASLPLSFPPRAVGSGHGRLGCDKQCHFPAKIWWAGMGNAIIVTSHFHSNVTVQRHKRSSFPQLPSWDKAAKHSPWYIPCAWRPQDVSPFPTQPVQDLASWCCFALGELQPAAKLGWKKSSKEVTLAGVQDFLTTPVPASKAVSQAQTHMVHKARGQRWPRGQGDTPLTHSSTPQGCSIPRLPLDKGVSNLGHGKSFGNAIPSMQGEAADSTAAHSAA